MNNNSGLLVKVQLLSHN